MARILRIPQAVLAEMWIHGLQEYPKECCGLLAGKKGRVSRCLPIRNDLQSETRYNMSAHELYWVHRKMDWFGLELLAIYHSHTRSPAYPSGTDVELASYPEVNYLLMSFQFTKPVQREPFPDTQAYWIRNGKIEPARADLI